MAPSRSSKPSQAKDSKSLKLPKPIGLEAEVSALLIYTREGARSTERLTQAILQHKHFKEPLANYATALKIRIQEKVNQAETPYSAPELLTVAVEEAKALREVALKRSARYAQSGGKKTSNIREVPISEIPNPNSR